MLKSKMPKTIRSPFRTAIALLAAIVIASQVLWATPAVALAAAQPAAIVAAAEKAAPAAPLTSGSYPVQQAIYDDATGDYGLMLLDTPRGTSPIFRSEKLQLARLTPEQIKAGQKPYLGFVDGQPVFYLSEDFKIDYIHTETAVQPNPQTGQPERVVVSRETNGWSPFAEVVTDLALLNLISRPMYYVPPIYSPGGPLRGYGGVGQTYDGAINSYRDRHNDAPIAQKNRQQFRTSRNLAPGSAAAKPNAATGRRATGSGFGGSTLRTGAARSRPSQPKSTANRQRFGSGSGFGSGRARSGFGSSFGGRGRASFGGRRR